MLTTTWRRFWQDERGAEMVEWALVTLILLTSTVVVIIALREEIIKMFAQVFEKNGRKNDAVRTYAAAVSAERPSPEIRTRLAAIAGASKVEELTRSNAPMLERARTFKVDATPGLKGSAEVALLLDSSSTPRAVLFIEGSEALRALRATIERLQIGPPLPDATAKVIRRGTLTCDGSGCMLKLVPAGHARPIH